MTTFTPLLKSLPFRQIGVYLVVGVVVFGAELTAFYLLRVGDFSQTSANILARSLGAVLGFTGNRIFTFARKESHRDKLRIEAFRYLLLFGFLTALSTGLLSLFTDLLGSTGAGWFETITKFVIDVFVVAVGFACQRLWVFRTPKAL